MPRQFALAVLFLTPAILLADENKDPGFVVHTGHFEKNTSGLKDEPSLLLLKDHDDFVSIFGTVPPGGFGGGNVRKNNPVTADTFDKNIVAAIIKRGNAITTYTEVSIKTDGDTLIVSFKSTAGNPGTATFASPLVVAVPKGKITKVVFKENGKEIGTVK